MSHQSVDYLPIALESIASASSLDFDLYQDSGDFYRLYRHRSVAISPDDLDKLSAHGCHTLYVPADQRECLQDHVLGVLPELLRGDSLPIERKYSLLTNASIGLYENIMADPSATGAIKGATGNCENHVALALQSESARTTMLCNRPKATPAVAHAIQVSNLSLLLGLQCGLSEPEDLKMLAIGGLLHEIGKTIIDPGYFTRQGSGNQIANTRLRGYPQIGADMLADSGTVPEEALRPIMEHQERLDGSGFPNHLRGSEISLVGRIVALCDHYDETLHAVATRVKPSPFQVLMSMRNELPKFDRKVYANFVRLLGTDIAQACCRN